MKDRSENCKGAKTKLICTCGANLVLCSVIDEMACPKCGCPKGGNMSNKKKIDWTKSELYYIDLGLHDGDFEEEIYVFNDGECWVVLEAFFDGSRIMHTSGDDAKEFENIEEAKAFAEKLVASYEVAKEKAE